jgi:ribosomal protein L7Ae-like RNA K-turn-binding protein
LSATRAATDKALKRGLFAKAAKAKVTVSPDLSQTLERQLRARALALLGLAHRAGQISFGFDKVAASVRDGKTALLILASDAAEGSRDKMRSALKTGNYRAEMVELFDRDELSLALGRENVVHAALRSGGLAMRFLMECNRLRGFCGNSDADVSNVCRSEDAREPGLELT